MVELDGLELDIEYMVYVRVYVVGVDGFFVFVVVRIVFEFVGCVLRL